RPRRRRPRRRQARHPRGVRLAHGLEAPGVPRPGQPLRPRRGPLALAGHFPARGDARPLLAVWLWRLLVRQEPRRRLHHLPRGRRGPAPR
ncbi:hypothetical protein BN1708_020503, partial [Verticillium longisporum]